MHSYKQTRIYILLLLHRRQCYVHCVVMDIQYNELRTGFEFASVIQFGVTHDQAQDFISQRQPHKFAARQ